MNRFIKLTLIDGGGPIWVRPDLIGSIVMDDGKLQHGTRSVTINDKATTIITLVHMKRHEASLQYIVTETPDQIFGMMGAMEVEAMPPS